MRTVTESIKWYGHLSKVRLGKIRRRLSVTLYVHFYFVYFGCRKRGVSASECRPTANTSHLCCSFHLSRLLTEIRGIILCIILYSIVRLIKLRSSRWMEHASCSEKMINARRFLAGKYERKR